MLNMSWLLFIVDKNIPSKIFSRDSFFSSDPLSINPLYIIPFEVEQTTS